MTRLFADRPAAPLWIQDKDIRKWVLPRILTDINTTCDQRRIDSGKVEQAFRDLIAKSR